MLDWGFANKKKHKPLTIVWACWAPWVSQGTTSSFEQEVQLQNMWLQIILWASGKPFLTTNNPTRRKVTLTFQSIIKPISFMQLIIEVFHGLQSHTRNKVLLIQGIRSSTTIHMCFAIQPVPKPPEMSEKEKMKASCNSPHSWWESQLLGSLLHYLLCSCPAGTLFATICHACAIKQPIFSLDTDFICPIWACSLLRTSYKRETEI